MNFEFFRRETAKKNMGLTELPAHGHTVAIAKGLEPIDFIGMIIFDGTQYEAINRVEVTVDGYTIGDTYKYNPETGEFRRPNPS